MRSFDTRFVTRQQISDARSKLLRVLSPSSIVSIDRTVISLDRLITFVNYVYGLPWLLAWGIRNISLNLNPLLSLFEKMWRKDGRFLIDRKFLVKGE